VKYRVRLARRSEIQTCRHLYAEFFEGCRPPREDSTWWVAVDENDEIAGFASACVVTGGVYLNSAGVLEQHRGNRLQRRLIEARVRWAKRHGHKSLVTYTMPDNAQSIVSLWACGFRTFEPDKPWWEPCDRCGAHGVLYWTRWIG
jgi:GNAT superfamily N-acetyltransferase